MPPRLVVPTQQRLGPRSRRGGGVRTPIRAYPAGDGPLSLVIPAPDGVVPAVSIDAAAVARVDGVWLGPGVGVPGSTAVAEVRDGTNGTSTGGVQYVPGSFALNGGNTGGYSGGDRSSRLLTCHVQADTETYVEMTGRPGGETYVFIGHREANTSADGATGYFVALNFASDYWRVEKNVAFAFTNLSGNQSFTLSEGTWYGVRFQTIGTTVRARVWDLSGAEPGTWGWEGTDSAIASAGAGTSLALGGAGSGPQVAYFRNITVTAAGSTADASVTAGPKILDAAATATGSGSAAVTAVKSLDATATATASGSAAASRSFSLAATDTVTATGSAAVSAVKSLAATAAATASGSAAASGVKSLAATDTATAGATGAVSRVASIAATDTATAGATAAVSRSATLAASATVTATGSADMSVSSGAVSIEASATATASATTDVVRVVSVAAEATVTGTGSAGVSATKSLAATGTTVGTAVAGVSRVASLAASAGAVADGSTSLSQVRSLAASAVVVAAGSANVSRLILLDASGSAAAAATTGNSRVAHLDVTADVVASGMAGQFSRIRRTWNGPEVRQEIGRPYKLYWAAREAGLTLLRIDGQWVGKRYVYPEDLAAADRVFDAGREETIDETEYNELVAAGYGAYVTEEVT